MKSQSWAQLLSELDQFSRSRGLGRKELALKMGIPYGTYRKWFQKTQRLPSPAHVQKIRSFLSSQQVADSSLQDLWRRILNWWETQHKFATVRELADSIGWDPIALDEHLSSKQPPPRLVLEKMASLAGLKAPNEAFSDQETRRKTEKIKYLLILLEEELRWFRDGSDRSRKILRDELDLNDVGYVSSLLTMLGDEGRFKRWLALTTNRFNFFKKRGGEH
jgi:transcriptional regulator with XRE-family HTH domain